uniref:Uncharacterized protein n=1 Tax=Aegilops tauschii subsp. strangulata TaxID=200361 RepID=A0A453SBX6_AEGTS
MVARVYAMEPTTALQVDAPVNAVRAYIIGPWSRLWSEKISVRHLTTKRRFRL